VYYTGRLAIPARSLEAEQRKDLVQAAATVQRLGEDLRVLAYFARRIGGRVRFEPAGTR
jgi:hypothetical protein